MSRSVDYLTGAELVTYMETPEEIEDSFDWEDFIEGIKYRLTKLFPSLYDADAWDGRETHIILENSFAEIGVSEYMGLVSLSIRAKPDSYEYSDRLEELGKQWIANIEKKFLALGDLVKLGAMSNGEGVYKRKESERL